MAFSSRVDTERAFNGRTGGIQWSNLKELVEMNWFRGNSNYDYYGNKWIQTMRINTKCGIAMMRCYANTNLHTVLSRAGFS